MLFCDMLKVLIKPLIGGLSVFLIDQILDGIQVASLFDALLAGVVIGLLNLLVKPVVQVLTLPVTVLSLGLFLLVINAGLILLVPFLVKGFIVSGFWPALWFSILYYILNAGLENLLLKEDNPDKNSR